MLLRGGGCRAGAAAGQQVAAAELGRLRSSWQLRGSRGGCRAGRLWRSQRLRGWGGCEGRAAAWVGLLRSWRLWCS